jgi:hypothetical protein
MLEWTTIVGYFFIGWVAGSFIGKLVKSKPVSTQELVDDAKPELRLTVEVRNDVIYFYELPHHRFIAQARTSDEFIEHLNARGFGEYIYLMSHEDISKVPWLVNELADSEAE